MLDILGCNLLYLFIKSRINFDQLILADDILWSCIFPCVLDEFWSCLWINCWNNRLSVIRCLQLSIVQIRKVLTELLHLFYIRPKLCNAQFSILWCNNMFCILQSQSLQKKFVKVSHHLFLSCKNLS